MKIERRTVLGLGALAGAATLLGRANAAPQAESSIARTRYGSVRGRRLDGVHVFKGIRYGADTGGTNRFMPPQPPRPWKGVVPAIEEGPQCFQIDHSRPNTRVELPESEDCLRLNVWTPGLRDGRKRPVMVWLHGGGLWRGSVAGYYEDWPGEGKRGRSDSSALANNESPGQEGRNLARNHDVVVVAPNHRLGVLAYTFLEDLDPSFHGSGNAGFLDQIAALKWVRDNIEEFGGDPGNVTIFGLSGGGQKVSLLLAMPPAKGLFHKAILMSGPAPTTVTAPYAKEMTKRLLATLGINPGDPRRLQALPPEKIMQGYFEATRIVGSNKVWGLIEGFGPVVDGHILPTQPFWDGAPSVSRDVPLIVGSTRTELTAALLDIDPKRAAINWAEAARLLRPSFADKTDGILEAFRAHHPDASPWEVYSLVLAHWPTRAFTLKIADEKAKAGGAPVRVYRTDWRTPVHGGAFMSPHAIDSAFAMDNAAIDHQSNGGGADALAMGRLVSAAWTSFARTGVPTAPGMPHWPVYDPLRRATMILDLPPHVVDDPDASDRATIQAYMRGYRPEGRDPVA